MKTRELLFKESYLQRQDIYELIKTFDVVAFPASNATRDQETR